jgi:hypothetical protein
MARDHVDKAGLPNEAWMNLENSLSEGMEMAEFAEEN